MKQPLRPLQALPMPAPLVFLPASLHSRLASPWRLGRRSVQTLLAVPLGLPIPQALPHLAPEPCPLLCQAVHVPLSGTAFPLVLV